MYYLFGLGDLPLFDLSGGLTAGEGGVDLDSVGFYCDYGGYYSEEVVDDLSDLRNTCDIYMDPGRLKGRCGGGFTLFKVDGLSYVRDAAKAALNAYNEENQMNFNLEKVVKLNQLSMYVYLTFWARSAENHDRRLFRAVVVPLHGNKVLLCEIKDDEEIMIPAGHKEYGVETESEEDHCPDTCVQGVEVTSLKALLVVSMISTFCSAVWIMQNWTEVAEDSLK